VSNVQPPVRHLSDAAEQVRAFNHTSMSAGPDWQFPSHSYDALGNLAYLLRMLPQAIEQAARPAMRTYEHGRIRIDNGGDADQAVRDLKQALSDALNHAEALAWSIDRMHNATSPMGLDTTGMPEFEDDTR
jgi:hypothetical protein